jgi:outer membrane murein-binding lipoprotein Lpp
MKKILIPMVGLLLMAGCGQSAREETATTATEEPQTEMRQEEEAPAASRESTQAAAVTEKRGEKAEVDFLSDCDALEIWQGTIQGVPNADARDMYIMAQCFSNREFDLIVYSNRKIGLSEAADDKAGTIKPNVPGAEYYAFEIPKREADPAEEETETFAYVFPSQVKVYKRFEDGWYQVHQEQVSSFEELGRLKLNTVQKRIGS